MPAHAQDERDSATARSLFEQGVELAEQADWTGAADRFARSNELRRSPVVAFNLASAWVELGKLVEASEVLRQIEKDPGAKPKLKKDARALLTRFEPKIGTLVVTVESGQQPHDEVRLNDRALPPAALGVPTPVDPGSVEITVVGGGELLWTKRVEVLPGGMQRVTIELPEQAPPPPVEPVVAPTPRQTAAAAPTESKVAASEPRDEESGSLLGEPLFWVGAGAVVVAGVVVAVVLLSGGGASTEAPAVGTLQPGHVKVPQ